MTRALAVAASGLVLVLAALACGGSGPEQAPAAPVAATQTATEPPAATTEPPATTTEPPATATDPPATATEPPATAPAPEEPVEEDAIARQIVTLLPPDAIPAINDPVPISAERASEQLSPTDLVIGVSINGEHRAYGAAFLSGHEIVNDMLGGRAIAVTW